MGNLQDPKAFFEFNVYKENNGRISMPTGEIIYSVTENGNSIHRVIKATVKSCYIEPLREKAWIVGEVISDTKGCKGGPAGHSTGCSSDHSSDDGCGESHDDASHDSGCTHGTEETDGGDACGGDTGNGGTGSHGNGLSGKNCRIGQIIALKVHDNDAGGDGITWKWFLPDAAFVRQINNISKWPHLCKKTIIEGDIVILQ